MKSSDSNGKMSNSSSLVAKNHTLTQSQDSVLALTHSNNHIFAATQSGLILCWQLTNFKLVKRLRAHYGHVLALIISGDGRFLFSAGDEGIIAVWDISSGNAAQIRCLALIHAGQDSGDIHAMAYSDLLGTIYIGCKNASIQVSFRYRVFLTLKVF